MGLYTLEVAGRPIACICAETFAEAEDTINDPWFRDELLGLERDGLPVWHGDTELVLRPTTPDELLIVQERLETSRRTGHPLESLDTIILLAPMQDRTPSDHRLILASRVEGAPVFNRHGERIGQIEDLSIDRVDGKVIYAIMSFGGFLGIGRKLYPLPWSLLQFDPERGGYRVSLESSALQNAPFYDVAELSLLGGPSYDADRQHIYDYYVQYGTPIG